MADWDRSPSPTRPPPTQVYLQLGTGIAITLLLHVAIGALLGAAALLAGSSGYEPFFWIGSLWLMGIGVTQLGYVLPAAAIAWVIRKPIGLGMVIGAGFTLLLNTGCYGSMVAFGLSS